jgi:hypothetical protein
MDDAEAGHENSDGCFPEAEDESSKLVKKFDEFA